MDRANEVLGDRCGDQECGMHGIISVLFFSFGRREVRNKDGYNTFDHRSKVAPRNLLTWNLHVAIERSYLARHNQRIQEMRGMTPQVLHQW